MQDATRGLPMLKLLLRLRPALLITSLVLLGAAGPTFAGDAAGSPDWRDVALAAVGIVSGLVTAWATFMQAMLSKVQRQLAETRELVLSEYQTGEAVKEYVRSGVQEAINPVNVRLARIETKLGVAP